MSEVVERAVEIAARDFEGGGLDRVLRGEERIGVGSDALLDDAQRSSRLSKLAQRREGARAIDLRVRDDEGEFELFGDRNLLVGRRKRVRVLAGGEQRVREYVQHRRAGVWIRGRVDEGHAAFGGLEVLA